MVEGTIFRWLEPRDILGYDCGSGVIHLAHLLKFVAKRNSLLATMSLW